MLPSKKFSIQAQTVDLSAIIRDQLKKNAEKFDRIKEAYRNGVDTLEEYQENKKLVQREKELLEKQLEECRVEEPEEDPSKAAMLERVRNVYEIICSDTVDNVTKNEILKNIIDKIVYNREKDELKVYYYYTPQTQ